MNLLTDNRTEPFFRWITHHPKIILLLGLLFIGFMGSFAPNLVKDTRADAFLADDNPALIYRDKVKALFGLSDPLVVALVADKSIFTPEGLEAVRTVTDKLRRIDNVDPEGVTSLATENNIVGTLDGLEVEPFFESDEIDQQVALSVRDAIRDFPLYQGSLVSKDESATLVIAEILDQSQVETTYQTIIETVSNLNLDDSIQIHIAGEGAIAGYLGGYIDSDAKRLNPLAGVVITIILFIAFLRFSATIMANVIVAASVVVTVGAMAGFAVPFYVITNALPVILIGIAVADSIHVYSEYFERRAMHPDESHEDSIVASMVEMWRPITLTTLTTAAGFIGLYFAAYMPPFKFFGLFTAIGVAAAWIYSLIFLPAAMALLKTDVSPRLARKLTSTKRDVFSNLMEWLGKITQRNAKKIVALAVLVVGGGFFAASHLVINEERIATFHPSEPIYQADKEINRRFNGTNYLDIVIETKQEEGLFDPTVLNRMDALQAYAKTLNNVNDATSIVDYLKQMNRALNEGNPDFYRLPQDQDLIAQYFLLYSTSGDPTDFEEEVDYNYRLANIRVTLNTGAFSTNRYVVEALQDYVDREFNDGHVTASLSGRVNLNYHWIKDLGGSHFFGVAIALVLVWLVSSLLFGSLIAGILALIPVAASILLVYSAMVVLSIPLGIGTSMFAAVAIGLGVDFAIHTIDRVKALYKDAQNMDQVFEKFYPSTGRALFFNLLALALGFGVLISSKVVPLNNFGTIVAFSVSVSFLFSMTVLPALIMVLKPKFITGNVENGRSKSGVAVTLLVSMVVVGAALFINSSESYASELPEGSWVAEKINQVDDGQQRTSKIDMLMIDRRGKERHRETVNFRKYFGEEKRTVLFYLTPRNVKNTGFLTYDYPDEKVDDDQWLYLPALRKARRISASDRGDYFLGTGFTYDDIKKEGKFEISDYHFKTLGKTQENGMDLIIVESTPVNEQKAEELGYGKVKSWVDSSKWIVVKAEYWDINLNPLKSLAIKDIRQIQGIWTRHILEVKNHKTGHFTRFTLKDVDYEKDVNDRLFTRQSLSRGAPR